MTAASLVEGRDIGRKRFSKAAVLLLTMLATSCASGIRLHTGPALAPDAAGTYRVYLYGCTYSNDIETMALLVDESVPYQFDLISLPTSYRVLEGLKGEQALAKARNFIRCGIYVTGASVLRSIADPSGRTIAFELKPLYSPLDMGADEVLLSSYFLHGNDVRVYLRLDPAVERSHRYDIPSMMDR